MSSTGAKQSGSYFHTPSFQMPFLFLSHSVAPGGPWADGWHLGRDNTRLLLPRDPHGTRHCCRGQQQSQVVHFLKHLLTKNVSLPAMSKNIGQFPVAMIFTFVANRSILLSNNNNLNKCVYLSYLWIVFHNSNDL